MKAPRLVLWGSLWLASLLVVYFFPLIPPAGKTARGPGEATATSKARMPSPADRVTRRAGDELPGEESRPKREVAPLLAEICGKFQTAKVVWNSRERARLLAPLLDLQASEMPEALAELKRAPLAEDDKTELYVLLLSRWAEIDGPAAMDYGRTLFPSEELMGGYALAQLMATWGRRDPDAAAQWLKRTNVNQTKYISGHKVAGGLGEHLEDTLSIAIASGRAANDLEGTLRQTGEKTDAAIDTLRAIAESATEEGPRQRMLEYAATTSEGLRSHLREAIAEHWMLSDPTAAVAWIESLPKEEQWRPWQAGVRTLMEVEPEAAARMMLSWLTERRPAEIYQEIAKQWPEEETDRLGKWLVEQPQGAELDLARAHYAAAVVFSEPATAMEWAQSILDEEMRRKSIAQVFRRWQPWDQAAARAALAAAGMSEGEAEGLSK